MTSFCKWETLTDTPTLPIYFLVELNTSTELFFPHVIKEWNKLGLNIRSFTEFNIFHNALLKFARSVERNVFNINDPFGIKMLKRLN